MTEVIEILLSMGDTSQVKINHAMTHYFDDVSMLILKEDELTTKTNLIIPVWCPLPDKVKK